MKFFLNISAAQKTENANLSKYIFQCSEKYVSICNTIGFTFMILN